MWYMSSIVTGFLISICHIVALTAIHKPASSKTDTALGADGGCGGGKQTIEFRESQKESGNLTRKSWEDWFGVNNVVCSETLGSRHRTIDGHGLVFGVDKPDD